MHRLRLAAATVGDQSHQTGTTPRNSRSRCKHHFARGRSQLPCARLIRLDTLRDNRLPRNVCKHPREKPSERDLRDADNPVCRPISLRPQRSQAGLPAQRSRQSDFPFVDLAPETLHGATSMRRDGRCCRKNFRTKHSRHPAPRSILCTRLRKPYIQCKQSDR